jgi:hypothetical protein
MAEALLRLVIDPATGKRHVVVQYESDADALPGEHEEQHQALVQALIARGVIGPDEAGQIVVERAPVIPVGPIAEEQGGARAAVAEDEGP